MGLIDNIVYRTNQKRANAFIEKLKKKEATEVEQEFLNNTEFQNNEIVLSYIFFNHPDLIRILPLEFQVQRINSNLSMFKYGSPEAKKQLVSSWFTGNKFFINANVIEMSDEEMKEYIKMYFKQPEDIPKLFMDDLRKVIEALAEIDLKQTEDVINLVKDKFNDRQWEFIIDVNPMFIKYASQNVQQAHSTDEKFISFLSGEARNTFINTQIEKLSEDITLLDTMDADVQAKYVREHPYMINYLSIETLINVLKYDSNLIRYVNLNINKNKEDKTQEVVCAILENIDTKTNKELVNVLISKCLLNAKAKLYRFDPNSNEISYQYTKRIIRILQGLTINQITTLIMIDTNYILPYIVPIYNDNTPIEEKKKITVDANSRCLNVFKNYFGEELYQQYYKTINKIYTAYIDNIEKYDFTKDYRCIFDIFKVLFNKAIMTNNSFDKISLFVGSSIFYKDIYTDVSRKTCTKLLNDLLEKAYNTKINNDMEIYNIGSLELFDSKLSFINQEVLYSLAQYNFANISNLLLITKSDKIYNLFKKYYEIVSYIFGENKESLYKIIENFVYYKNIIEDIQGKELNDEELDNLSLLLSTYNNKYKINKKEELSNYSLILFKKLVSDLSQVKDESMYKNILCNYLFNRGYDEKGNVGWLEVGTIKQMCDLYEIDSLSTLSVDGQYVFSEDEVNLFSMTKLLFSVNDFDLLLSFVNNIIANKVKRNTLGIIDLFNKIKKYKLDLINNEIVSLDEIKDLYETSSGVVTKNSRDGVEIYTITGQNFRVLCSVNAKNESYECVNVIDLDKNVYVYDRLSDNVRITSEDGKTIIKPNEASIDKSDMDASYILLCGKMNDDLFEIAKIRDLCVVEVIK